MSIKVLPSPVESIKKHWWGWLGKWCGEEGNCSLRGWWGAKNVAPFGLIMNQKMLHEVLMAVKNEDELPSKWIPVSLISGTSLPSFLIKHPHPSFPFYWAGWTWLHKSCVSILSIQNRQGTFSSLFVVNRLDWDWSGPHSLLSPLFVSSEGRISSWLISWSEK